MPNYMPRVVDSVLERKLSGKGAVLIEGAKWCGKTTTAEQHAASVLSLSNPDTLAQSRAMAELQPMRLLQGGAPRLLDEWQLIPQLWDAVRFEVDQRRQPGQFILTGSAVPPSLKDVRHTGTGRFAWVRMRPMSLLESGDSSGAVSLRRLFAGEEEVDGENPLDLERVAWLVCRGGWPQAIPLKGDAALEQALDYHVAVIRQDASRVDGVMRSPDRVRRFLRSYARLQGTQASQQSICADLGAGRSTGFSADTVHSYLEALRKIFVIEDLETWMPDLRARVAIRTAETRFFTDPSIAVAALGVGPADLLDDLRSFGFFFEALSVRDLRVFAEALDGSLYHYRDSSGLECDAVLHRRNGTYGLIEVKLGGERLIEEGAANLRKLVAKLDLQKMRAPSFQMVLVAEGKYAYRRKDGVLVVPLGCLGV